MRKLFIGVVLLASSMTWATDLSHKIEIDLDGVVPPVAEVLNNLNRIATAARVSIEVSSELNLKTYKTHVLVLSKGNPVTGTAQVHFDVKVALWADRAANIYKEFLTQLGVQNIVVDSTQAADGYFELSWLGQSRCE